MDGGGIFSRGGSSFRPQNFSRPVLPQQPKQEEKKSPVSGMNKKFLLIGILAVSVLVLVGSVLWIISNKELDSSKNPVDIYELEEDIIPEITFGGCEVLGLFAEEDVKYSCFNSNSGKISLYVGRSSENVILKKVNFVLYSLNDSVNYSSSYSMAPGAFYTYQIPYNLDNLDRIEIIPIVQEDGGEEVCESIFVNLLEDCPAEEIREELSLDYLVGLDVENETEENQTESIGVLFSEKPQKKILEFSFIGLNFSAVGIVDNVRHIVRISVPENVSVNFLTPLIKISENATISPVSGVSRDFTNPVNYIVSASDNTTQMYTVYVSSEYVEEEVRPTNLLPVVSLDSIESSNTSSRVVSFSVLDETVLPLCYVSVDSVLYNFTSVGVNINKTLNLDNLGVGNHSIFVNCTDVKNESGISSTVSFRIFAPNVPLPVDGSCGNASKNYSVSESGFGTNVFCASGNISVVPTYPLSGASSSWACLGLNGGMNSSCSASRVIVRQIGSTVAGEGTASLAEARLMAQLNKNFYIVDYGDLRTCSRCRTVEKYVFSQDAFKQWAYEKGIAIVAANGDDLDEPTKTVRAVYVKPLLDKGISVSWPFIIIVGYERDVPAIAAFSLVSGYTVNGIKLAYTPERFIQALNSYTSQYQ